MNTAQLAALAAAQNSRAEASFMAMVCYHDGYTKEAVYWQQEAAIRHEGYMLTLDHYSAA